MNAMVTGGLAALCLVLAILFGWLGMQPAKMMSKPRLAPYRLLMLVAFGGMIGLLKHLVDLARST
jgi:hypothetical protein